MRETSEQLDNASTEYWAVVTGGIFDVVVNSWSVWNGKDSRLYRHERRNLQKYVNPVYIGLGTAFFVFVNFRVFGSRRFQSWRKQLYSQAKGQSEISNTATKQEQQWVGPSHLERLRDEKEKAALQSVRLLTDVLVSISVGTSASLLFLDAKKATMRKDFEDAPKVSGRSLFADSICPGMVKVADKFQHEPSLYADRPNLVTFSKLVSNCRLRDRAENDIRARLGKLSDEPVAIPPAMLENNLKTNYQ